MTSDLKMPISSTAGENYVQIDAISTRSWLALWVILQVSLTYPDNRYPDPPCATGRAQTPDPRKRSP